MNFFLRDDDIDVVEDSLARLLEICRRQGAPISLAVIPGRLTGEAAAFLKEQVFGNPDLVELHQHGWKHVNHETQGKKCEFGASRSAAEQYADIAAGKAQMDEAFGNAWFPAFTPPWNRCTADTCRALERLDFRVLSTDCAVAGWRSRQAPITLDLYRWKGNPALRPAAEISRELAAQVGAGRTVGLLLHHKVMDAAAFEYFESLLIDIRRNPLARFHTLRTAAA